jgi:hypothetical protein
MNFSTQEFPSNSYFYNGPRTLEEKRDQQEWIAREQKFHWDVIRTSLGLNVSKHEVVKRIWSLIKEKPEENTWYNNLLFSTVKHNQKPDISTEGGKTWQVIMDDGTIKHVRA